MQSRKVKLRPYFCANNTNYYYDEIGNKIAKIYPELVGKHIFKQLEAVGLWEVFEISDTPYSLPYSFSSYASEVK